MRYGTSTAAMTASTTAMTVSTDRRRLPKPLPSSSIRGGGWVGNAAGAGRVGARRVAGGAWPLRTGRVAGGTLMGGPDSLTVAECPLTGRGGSGNGGTGACCGGAGRGNGLPATGGRVGTGG